MKLALVKYKCANCGFEFEAPELPSGTYGEFLLRSQKGETAYLDAFKDKTYDEVDDILSKMSELSDMTPSARAALLRSTYGEAACDKDSNEEAFVLGAHLPCPNCGSQKMKHWEFKEPPEVVDADIPSVQHTSWQMLDEQGKAAVVREALSHVPALGKQR